MKILEENSIHPFSCLKMFIAPPMSKKNKNQIVTCSIIKKFTFIYFLNWDINTFGTYKN
jgi:hypothetical protein